MIASLLPTIGAILGKVIDRAIPDEAEREKVRAAAMQELMQLDMAKLEAASKVIMAEATGESWLQRNWRPILMLWFAALVGAHWLGFTPENLHSEAVNGLLDIVLVGTGGYVLGRSGEKIARTWKQGEIKSESGPKGLF